MAAPPTNQVSSLLQANSDESGMTKPCAEVLQVVHHRPMGDWVIGYRLWAIAVAREMAVRWWLKTKRYFLNF